MITAMVAMNLFSCCSDKTFAFLPSRLARRSRVEIGSSNMAAVVIPSARAERLLIIAGRALTPAGVALGVVPCFIVFYQFDNGDKIFDDPIWVRIAFCLLRIVPLPIAWWIGRSIAPGTAALAVLAAGMALALAFEVRIYWNVFPLNVAAPIAVILVPAFQLLFLALIVLLAWLTARWLSWR